MFHSLVSSLIWDFALPPLLSASNDPPSTTSNTEGAHETTEEFDLLRAKGFLRTRSLDVGEEDQCFILQGVRDVFDIVKVPFVPIEEIESKLVLIGRGFVGKEGEVRKRFLGALEKGLEEERRAEDEVEEEE